jgi:K+/H+ antiporter YhaU regulatory subunit KhtT
VRNQQVIPNPKSDMRFQQGDLLGLIGEMHELTAATHLLNSSEN